MHSPVVTIGIPCYNAKDTVRDAIEAALGQDYPNIEVIVIDDCSTDGTQNYLLALQNELKFKLIFLPVNSGVAKICNTVIEVAEGDYVAFCGDDDMFVKSRISKQMKQLLSIDPQGEQFLMSFVARTQVFSNANHVYEPAVFRTDGKPLTNDELVSWTVLGRYGSLVSGSAGSGTCLAHKSVYQKLNGYDEDFRRASDVEFVLRFVLLGGKIVTLQESLLIQRMTAGADKSSSNKKHFFNLMLQKHKFVLSQRGLYQAAFLFTEIKCAYFKRDWITLIKSSSTLFFTNPKSFCFAVCTAIKRRQIIRSRRQTIQAPT